MKFLPLCFLISSLAIADPPLLSKIRDIQGRVRTVHELLPQAPSETRTRSLRTQADAGLALLPETIDLYVACACPVSRDSCRNTSSRGPRSGRVRRLPCGRDGPGNSACFPNAISWHFPEEFHATCDAAPRFGGSGGHSGGNTCWDQHPLGVLDW